MSNNQSNKVNKVSKHKSKNAKYLREIIRLSRVIAELGKCYDHYLVHTGQNYDYELNKICKKNLVNLKLIYMQKIKFP